MAKNKAFKVCAFKFYYAMSHLTIRKGRKNKKGKIITKKPIIPTNEEIKRNPRSRSSKMRIFKFD